MGMFLLMLMNLAAANAKQIPEHDADIWHYTYWSSTRSSGSPIRNVRHAACYEPGAEYLLQRSHAIAVLELLFGYLGSVFDCKQRPEERDWIQHRHKLQPFAHPFKQRLRLWRAATPDCRLPFARTC
jgi:hypothetical protein